MTTVTTDEAQNPTQELSEADMERAIRRIQAALTLAKGAGNEHEADNAMATAQALAAKYNLDIAQVEAAAGAKHDKAAVERVKDEVKGRAMYKWQQTLAKYVAEANFCYHLIKETRDFQRAGYKYKGVVYSYAELIALPDEEREHIKSEGNWVDSRAKTIKSHIFVGRKGNVITAQLMYQYLTQTIEDSLPITDNSQRLSRSAMSWKEGCADRLCERLAARRRDLFEKHDARVKQEEADRQAERVRKAAEKAAAAPKGLPSHHPSEVKAGIDRMASGAYDRSGGKPELEEQDQPEVDPNDTWTPEGEEVEQPDAGVAMVLASVFDQSERDANWEVAHGYKPGTLAKWRAERDERERMAAEAQAEEEISNVDAPVKQETERQRNARIKREADQEAKRRRRWARQSAAEERREYQQSLKRDWGAYRAGAAKGKDIGLDTQVKAGKDAKKLGAG